MSMPLVIQERFCRQSAALIAAGFSLPDVFAYLRVSLPKYRPIWERIETDLASGIGLPEASWPSGISSHPLSTTATSTGSRGFGKSIGRGW